jgi:hypothetical protein
MLTFSFVIKGKTKMFKPLDEADEVQECAEGHKPQKCVDKEI